MDTLSRAPSGLPTASDQLLHQEADVFVNMVIQDLPASDNMLEEIKQHQEEGQVCKQVRNYRKEGWPTKQEVPGAVLPFYPVSAKISVENSLLLRGRRIVIPSSMRLNEYAREATRRTSGNNKAPGASLRVSVVARVI